MRPAPLPRRRRSTYGDISHKGLKNLGPASTGLKLSLQLGMIANQQGIANAVKAASNPTSSTYGKYLSLSTLQNKYGASSSRRKAVVGAFKNYGVTATVDVTHLRVGATISIKNAQKLFGTKWDLYATGQKNQAVALPVNTPKLGSGLNGNVDTVSGLRLYVTQNASASSAGSARAASRRRRGRRRSRAGRRRATGTINPGCASTTYPAAVFSTAGLFPNQILTAYGIAPLQASGLQGQGMRVAILGEAPTPVSDVTAYRNCFGFQGTTLKIHGGSGIAPILESSLDAMTIAMVAPKLARLDLWVKALGQSDPQGALELLAEPLQATTNGTPLPNVISISYGVCEATVAPYTRRAHAVRPPARRDRRARDHDRRRGRRQRLVVVRARRAHLPARPASTSRSRRPGRRPRRGCSPPAARTSRSRRRTRSRPRASGTTPSYPPPYQQTAAGGGGVSTFEKRPWWQPATSSQKTYRMVPDVAAFADASPGYAIICSHAVQGCGPSAGQTIAFVGGTSAAAPLVAGMIALWDQQAQQARPAQARVRPAAAVLRSHNTRRRRSWTSPPATNAVFSGVSCCTADPGFDLASGLGSPLADQIAKQLHH